MKNDINITETITENITEKLTNNQKKIIESIVVNPSITSEELSVIEGIVPVNDTKKI